MKRILGLVTLLAALAVGVIGVSAASGSSTNFKGTYSGKVTEVVNGTAVTATPKGAGKGTLIGKGTLTGTVGANTANPPCTPITGPGLIKGLKATLKFKLVNAPAPSKACAAGADDQNNISFSGTAKAIGGTGFFKKATGLLHFYGHYDRATGAFNVTLTGTLKY